MGFDASMVIFEMSLPVTSLKLTTKSALLDTVSYLWIFEICIFHNASASNLKNHLVSVYLQSSVRLLEFFLVFSCHLVKFLISNPFLVQFLSSCFISDWSFLVLLRFYPINRCSAWWTNIAVFLRLLDHFEFDIFNFAWLMKVKLIKLMCITWYWWILQSDWLIKLGGFCASTYLPNVPQPNYP